MDQGGDKIPNWVFITREVTVKCHKLFVWFCIQSRLICNCLWLGISHLSLSDDNKADTLRISCTGERTVINQNPLILFPLAKLFNFDGLSTHSSFECFPCNNLSENTTKKNQYLEAQRCLSLKQHKIPLSGSEYLWDCWVKTTSKEKVFQKRLLCIEQSLSKKNADVLLFDVQKSRNGKQRRHKNFVWQSKFLIPNHTQLNFILAVKFVAGLSRLGYALLKNCWLLSLNLENSQWMQILVNDCLTWS